MRKIKLVSLHWMVPQSKRIKDCSWVSFPIEFWTDYVHHWLFSQDWDSLFDFVFLVPVHTFQLNLFLLTFRLCTDYIFFFHC